MQPGPHYVNTVLLKVKFAFCVFCLMLTVDILLVSYLESQKFYVLFVPLGGFILTKLVVHYLIYSKVKYKDDGRELVSFADFFTI